jgi:transposase
MWPDLVPAGLYSDSLSSSATARQGLGHFGNLRKPRRQRLGLYYQLYFDNIGQEEVCMFLRELLRHLRGQVIVVLDNSSTHKGEPLQQLLRQYSRLHIEHFPSYAPELNPDEGVWSLAKRALANGCPNDVEELVEDVIRSINGIRISTRKLRGCVVQSELPSFFRFAGLRHE